MPILYRVDVPWSYLTWKDVHTPMNTPIDTRKLAKISTLNERGRHTGPAPARTFRRSLSVVLLVAVAGTALAVLPGDAAAAAARKATKSTKPKIPRPGTPCTQRGLNFTGTGLDCVSIPAKGLQWRVRGTVRNPFRPGESVDVYSLESSRYRVALTDWDSDISQESREQGVDLAVPGIAFLSYRISSTLLASGSPSALNRASEATAPFAYVVGAVVRENQRLSLSQVPQETAIADQPACRDGRIKDAFTPAVGKDRLERLAMGETGWNGFCKEVPAEESANVVVELNGWTAPGGPNAKTAVSYYFTGIKR